MTVLLYVVRALRSPLVHTDSSAASCYTHNNTGSGHCSRLIRCRTTIRFFRSTSTVSFFPIWLRQPRQPQKPPTPSPPPSEV